MHFFTKISALVLLLAGIVFCQDKIDYDKLNDEHAEIISGAEDKWEKYVLSLPPEERVVIDYDTLLNKLDENERKFVEQIFSINPVELGFKGPFYSTEKPGKLVKVESVEFTLAEIPRSSGVQYCPEHSYIDFTEMSNAYHEETGRKFFIDSGYRSPGRQAYVFIRNLVKNDRFSLRKTAKWIAMPGYSEHGHPVNNAIDIANEYGINGFSEGQKPADFENSPEFKWLTENAVKYNFYLTYPKNNKYGVGYEPWHWHWEQKEK